jgi:four helix bundle protein
MYQVRGCAAIMARLSMAAHFKDLVVWQKSMVLAKQVIVCTHSFPKHETYGQGSQLRNAAVSVPSNISEGQQRFSNADFRHFLRIARGSLAELETQLILAKELGYLTPEQLNVFSEQIASIGKLIAGLIRSLSARAASA